MANDEWVQSGPDMRVQVMTRTARKPHTCRHCRTPIVPGSLYSEIPEGPDPFHPLRYHPECAVTAWDLRPSDREIDARRQAETERRNAELRAWGVKPSELSQ